MSPADSSNAAVACDMITQLSPATKQLQIEAPAFAGSYLHNNYPNQRSSCVTRRLNLRKFLRDGLVVERLDR